MFNPIALHLALVAVTSGAPLPAGPASAQFALAIHVATATPDRTDRRVERLVAEASHHFRAAAIGFHVVEKHTLPAPFACLDNIRQRHQLKRYLVPRAINIFIVDEIRDPHPSAATRRAAAWQGRAPSGRLAGAHIEAPGRQPATYIILTPRGSSLSLTHELGHFFGLPHHREPTNIMSYGRSRDHFSAAQLHIARRGAKRYRRTKAVRLISPP